MSYPCILTCYPAGRFSGVKISHTLTGSSCIQTLSHSLTYFHSHKFTQRQTFRNKYSYSHPQIHRHSLADTYPYKQRQRLTPYNTWKPTSTAFSIGTELAQQQTQQTRPSQGERELAQTTLVPSTQSQPPGWKVFETTVVETSPASAADNNQTQLDGQRLMWMDGWSYPTPTCSASKRLGHSLPPGLQKTHPNSLGDQKGAVEHTLGLH